MEHWSSSSRNVSSMYLCSRLPLLFGRGDFLSPAGCDVVHALALAPVAAAGGDEAGAWPVGLDRPPAEARDGGYPPLDPPLAIAAPLKLLPAAAPASPVYACVALQDHLSLQIMQRKLC